MAVATQFWEHKSLAELDDAEWESLCDRCGKCCLAKLEDVDSGEVSFTRVICFLYDTENNGCGDYSHRQQKVSDCFRLTPDNIADTTWLPVTCAYRLRYEGRPLFDWHPLISGSFDSVHAAGMSVKDRVLSERDVHPESFEEHVIQWVN